LEACIWQPAAPDVQQVAAVVPDAQQVAAVVPDAQQVAAVVPDAQRVAAVVADAQQVAAPGAQQVVARQPASWPNSELLVLRVQVQDVGTVLRRRVAKPPEVSV
jgi:hypothetical protein